MLRIMGWLRRCERAPFRRFSQKDLVLDGLSRADALLHARVGIRPPEATIGSVIESRATRATLVAENGGTRLIAADAIDYDGGSNAILAEFGDLPDPER